MIFMKYCTHGVSNVSVTITNDICVTLEEESHLLSITVLRTPMSQRTEIYWVVL